jgi:glycerate dehydrogenase
MKAVFLDFATLGPDELDTAPLLEALPDTTFYDSTAPMETAGRIRDAEFVLLNKTRLDAAALAEATRLRFIGLTATGTDNVDLEAARKLRIAVANVRAYCTRSVVEHVFGMLLNLTHSLNRYHRAVKEGDWRDADVFCLLDYPIRQLSAMTLGIVGYGELGRGVASMARSFGMRTLIAARPGMRTLTTELREAPATDPGRIAFGELLERSDIVSLHCPLTPQTRNLMGAAEFSRMRRGAILINTARGGLVDSQALVDALRAGKLAGAGIDVLREEPPANGDPLLDYDGDNLILTPHIAWATVEARQNAIDELGKNIVAFLRGKERNRVL